MPTGSAERLWHRGVCWALHIAHLIHFCLLPAYDHTHRSASPAVPSAGKPVLRL